MVNSNQSNADCINYMAILKCTPDIIMAKTKIERVQILKRFEFLTSGNVVQESTTCTITAVFCRAGTGSNFSGFKLFWVSFFEPELGSGS